MMLLITCRRPRKLLYKHLCVFTDVLKKIPLAYRDLVHVGGPFTQIYVNHANQHLKNGNSNLHGK